MPLFHYNMLLTFLPIDNFMSRHPAVPLLCLWAMAMLSYHQDVKHPRLKFAPVSQIIAVTCLVTLVVFGFTRKDWLNFLIAPAFALLHIQFTKRWSARPGTWW
jgi:hypothetical protein